MPINHTGHHHTSDATRTFDNDTTQSERREVLKNDRLVREDAQQATYFEMAQGDGDPNAPTVVGSTRFGPKLPAPTWSRDLAATPKERPLGARVDDLVDMETCWWEEGAVGPRGGQDDGDQS